MSPKFYIKYKTPNEVIYYPCVEGVVFDNIPCKTATEAQYRGLELFKLAVTGGKHEQGDGSTNNSSDGG